MDYKETIKERIKILPDQLKNFVLDENWRRDAEKMAKQFNLGDEKYASLENEIFFVLLGFEPKADFAENIKRELGLDQNTAGWIAEDVEKEIFSKVSNEIDEMWKEGSVENPIEPEKPPEPKQPEQIEVEEEIKSEIKTPEILPQNNVEPAPHSEGGVGNDFEQIILNQAKAMRPATAPPSNLPTSDGPKTVPDYRINEDPYREPLE
jgi:hypothetical protein